MIEPRALPLCSMESSHEKPTGMYARCRNALQRTTVLRRFSRRIPLITGLILGLFLWTASRLHNGSPVLPGSIFGPGRQKPEPPPVEEPPERPHYPGMERLNWQPGMCNVPEIEFLRRPELGLTSNIVYSRRCVRSARSKTNPSHEAVTNITEPLITTKTKVDLADCSTVELPPCEPITLQVSPPYPHKQYKHLMFGVASSYERINQSLADFEHWAANSGVELLFIVADAFPQEGGMLDLQGLEQEYTSRGMRATMIPPTIRERINRFDQEGEGPAPIEQHHFMLVRELHQRSTPGLTRWIAVLDDDTFFPSLHLLDEGLSKYDHTKHVWLGALSDDFGAIKNFGIMGYGGAGVFLSPSLASTLSAHAEQCLRESTTFSGDGMLRDCVYTHSRAGLTLMPGLYQHDIRGDASGFFESGVLPVSLHHWKSWYRAPVAAISRVATLVCGNCMLQRWRFGHDTLLANGYSIAVYRPGVLDKLDLSRVEGTWEQPTRDFDFFYGKLREKISRDEKKTYLLRDSVLDEKAKVFRQVYVYRADEFEYEQAVPSGVDEVVELVWELD